MHDRALLIFSFLAGVQREKGLALLCRTASGLSERETFDAQAARNEVILSQIRDSGLPQTLFLPHKILESIALRNQPSFRDNLDFDSLSEWYAAYLERPAQQAARALLAEWPGLTASQSSALTHLLESLEIMSLLQDAGLTIYSRSEITNTDSLRMRTLAHAYLAQERLFLNLASEHLRAKLHVLKLADPEKQNAFDDAMRDLREGHAKSLFSQTPAALWFQTMDSFRDHRHKALAMALTEFAQKAQEDETFRAMANALDSSVESEIPALSSLPLFRGLTESGLRATLQNAKIIRIDRNQSLLAQGEPISRLYLVMDGLLKSFKTAEEGGEAVLQILGKRDCLLDTGLLGGPSPVGVKAVTRARLLGLSLITLREQSARSPVLTANLLALTSLRHQKLLAHFEQITLRQAQQRVGWFLVNLHLETGLDGAPLKLPFDKALIAAYLNITPETLSRVLNAFKKDGFKIQKDEVVLPHPQALCAFCDPSMALRCCRAETVDCAPIRAVRKTVTA